MTVDEFLARHSLHPLALVLLVRWSRTPEGQRFVAGAPLAPMDDGRAHARQRRNTKRRNGNDFDWGLMDG